MTGETRFGEQRGRGGATAMAFAEKTNPHRLDARSSGGCGEPRGESRPYPARCDPTDPRRPLTDAQRELATRYIPLAKALARRAGRSPAHYDDMEAEAYGALVGAARSFDPGRGVDFAVHARLRIRGALRDFRRFLFHAGWKGRPDATPVFERLTMCDAVNGQFIGIEPEPPVGQADELHEALEAVIRRLPRPQAAACRSIYIDGKSANEAAAALGYSAGHLSRLQGDAIVRLRRDFREALAG